MSKNKKYIESKPRSTFHAVLYTVFFFVSLYAGGLSYMVFNEITVTKEYSSYDNEIEHARHVVSTDKYAKVARK